MTTTTDKIDPKLIDQLLKDYQSPEDVLGENGILKQFDLCHSRTGDGRPR